MLPTKKEKRSKFLKWVDKHERVIYIFCGVIAMWMLVISAIDLYKTFLPTNIDKNIVETFFEEEILAQEEIVEGTEEASEVKRASSSTNYIALLEIPSIKLINGLVDIDSKSNTVERNIQIIKPSDMPDIESGNLTLAGHSGNSKISYFRNLYKLKKNDTIFIYYKGNKYTYSVIDIYDIEKTGSVKLKTHLSKTILNMITCRTNTDKQIVVVSELVSVEEHHGKK